MSLCEKCGRQPVAGCGGRGYIREDDITVSKCVNIHRRELAQHLGPEIANCTHTSNTPLLRLSPEGGPPLADLTAQNLKIKCGWRELLPHLKFVLGIKYTLSGSAHRFRIVTDERIRNVFVGSEAYSARSQKVRDDLDSYNKLADFLGADYDLVIVKLGYLGYKNAAAPGALKEALLHRESINKSTWLVLDPNKPWTHSHDLDVEGYVDENYAVLELATDPAVVPEEPSSGMSEFEGDTPTFSSLVGEPEAASDLPGDLMLPGEGQPDRRKPWKRVRGR